LFCERQFGGKLAGAGVDGLPATLAAVGIYAGRARIGIYADSSPRPW
jgi:hypothetical protein